MSRLLPVDNLESDPTSGLMQRDMQPGSGGQSIDDHLHSTYTSMLPAHDDFGSGYYFASHFEPFESTPVDSLSGVYDSDKDDSLNFHRYLFGFRATSTTSIAVRLRIKLLVALFITKTLL